MAELLSYLPQLDATALMQAAVGIDGQALARTSSCSSASEGSEA